MINLEKKRSLVHFSSSCFTHQTVASNLHQISIATISYYVFLCIYGKFSYKNA